MAERILVVEDDPDLLAFFGDVLEGAGYRVAPAGSGRTAEGVLRTAPVDAVITDLKMPVMSGLEVLKFAKKVDPEIVVILVTGFPAVETAVEAMKFGALDYLVKPVSSEQLLGVLGRSLEKRRAKEAYGLLRSVLRSARKPSGIVGQAARIFQLFNDIRRAAAVDTNVLVLGESGSGKELVARTIHDDSDREGKPFLAINCAAIPEHLLEAELFGYERGAFTGAQVSKEGLLEAANGGTLLLDEVCELHPLLQAKLLRAVEERAIRRLGGRKLIPFDVRFIASTNRDIHEEVRKERFRDDLFFRLGVIEIKVPSLRERREDIPLLAAHFLAGCSPRRPVPIEGIAQDAMDILARYDWPGNVRELRNAIERAVAYAEGPLIAPKDLPEAVLKGAEGQDRSSFRAWKEKTLERLEKEFLEQALEEHGGNVSHAAKALGVHRSTLQRFMRKHNLPSA
jgi:DNA-binding NtrC family response regulator